VEKLGFVHRLIRDCRRPPGAGALCRSARA